MVDNIFQYFEKAPGTRISLQVLHSEPWYPLWILQKFYVLKFWSNVLKVFFVVFKDCQTLLTCVTALLLLSAAALFLVPGLIVAESGRGRVIQLWRKMLKFESLCQLSYFSPEKRDMSIRTMAGEKLQGNIEWLLFRQYFAFVSIISLASPSPIFEL